MKVVDCALRAQEALPFLTNTRRLGSYRGFYFSFFVFINYPNTSCQSWWTLVDLLEAEVANREKNIFQCRFRWGGVILQCVKSYLRCCNNTSHVFLNFSGKGEAAGRIAQTLSRRRLSSTRSRKMRKMDPRKSKVTRPGTEPLRQVLFENLFVC